MYMCGGVLMLASSRMSIFKTDMRKLRNLWCELCLSVGDGRRKIKFPTMYMCGGVLMLASSRMSIFKTDMRKLRNLWCELCLSVGDGRRKIQ